MKICFAPNENLPVCYHGMTKTLVWATWASKENGWSILSVSIFYSWVWKECISNCKYVIQRFDLILQTAMMALPVFSPRSIPIKAAGMFSKPFVTCSRLCSLPCRWTINKFHKWQWCKRGKSIFGRLSMTSKFLQGSYLGSPITY